MADLISQLSDEIVCHILSFLPTKVAVTTTVLSKRFHSLWRSVPALDFDENDVTRANEMRRFCHLVETVMLQREPKQAIRMFRLRYPSYIFNDDPFKVVTWVDTATQRGTLEHLDLSLFRIPFLSLRIPATTTLVVLKLKNLALIVNDVYSTGFPSLKVLHLNHVAFQHQSNLEDFLSLCPNLQDLRICSVRFSNSGAVVTGDEFRGTHKLVRADVGNIEYFAPLKWICNMEFPRIKEMYSYVNTFGNLTCLELITQIHNWNWLVEMLKYCPKLQILGIEKRQGKSHFLDVDEWVDPKFVPKCLSSLLRTCNLRNIQGLDCEMKFAKYVLQSAKVLKTLTISINKDVDQQKKCEMMEYLSVCPMSSVTCKLSLE